MSWSATRSAALQRPKRRVDYSYNWVISRSLQDSKGFVKLDSGLYNGAMYQESQGRVPFWLWGVLAALILIAVSRSRLFSDNAALTQHFAPQPTVIGAQETASAAQSDWSAFPTDAQQVIRDIQEKLGQGQSAPVLTPVAQGPRLKVEVREVRPTTTGVQVVGQVTNISPTALDIPVNAFQFRDSAGNLYASAATETTRLDAGATTPLDLGVPLPAGRGLSLVVRFDPDPLLEQVLIVAPKT